MSNKFKLKKIAFITPIYLPANLYGSGVLIKELAEKFAQKGLDVSVVTSNAHWYNPIFRKRFGKDFEIINNVKIYRLPCNQIISSICFILVRYLYFLIPDKILNKLKIVCNGPFLLGLEDLLRKHQFDIIHCSPFPLNINKQVTDAIKLIKNKSKLIITPFFHSDVSEFNNPLLGDIFKQADYIHTVSYAEKNEIINLFDLDEKKIIVIPPFLNMEQLHSQKQLKYDILKFKKTYNLRNRKIILFAGRKGAMKGCVDLLLAINELYKKDQSYILLAIGESTPDWEKTKSKIDKGCLIDFGYKTGKTKELFFATADVFCMPSKSESFGLVYLEAWHKKRPAISADIPSERELIAENSGGMTVPYADKNALQMVITKLIQNPVLSNKLGANGYKALIKKYTMNKLLPKYLRLFKI